MIASKSLRLFLLSFCTLFFELTLIRYLPAHITHIGFFSNLILLACFLGMGVGILLSRRNLPLMQIFPALLLLVLVAVRFYQFGAHVQIEGVVYFQATGGKSLWMSGIFLLPLVFILVALLMATLCCELGSLLRSDTPLKVYFINILGSLAGILAFNACSHYYLSPVMWFSILLVIVLYLEPRSWSKISNALCIITLLILAYDYNASFIWSRYYKIALTPDTDGYHIAVNNTSHQYLHNKKRLRKTRLYTTPYQLMPEKKLENVLIIGSGGGNDVYFAASKGIQVDAVEIDEVIFGIGKELHPEKPYSKSGVQVVVEDGRTFIENTEKKYDMIIFALTDSLVLYSAFANLRLESYLYTLDSLRSAKKLLRKDGVVVLYNSYREDWLIDKIAAMVKETFAKDPAVVKVPEFLNAAIIIGGENLEQYPQLQNYRMTPTSHPPATDDWPFLYMQKPSLPFEYIRFVIIFLAISGLAIFVTMRNVMLKTRWSHGHFFFLGAAFLLLETKSITTFSLLFGSTWMVNSIVFFVILSLVLLAIIIQMRWEIRSNHYWYIALLVMIVLNYAIPMRTFDFENFYIRLVAAGVFYLSPIFLANMIFAQSFKSTEEADLSFAANLLGAMVGGFMEYSAMLIGYNALMGIVFLLYLAAFLSRKKEA